MNRRSTYRRRCRLPISWTATAYAVLSSSIVASLYALLFAADRMR